MVQLFSFLRSMLNLRLPSFFQTRTTMLAHGLYDFLMAHISSISWRWAFTSSYICGVYICNALYMASDQSTWSSAWSRMSCPGPGCCRQIGAPIWVAAFWPVLVLLQATPPGPGDSMLPWSIPSVGHEWALMRPPLGEPLVVPDWQEQPW